MRGRCLKNLSQRPRTPSSVLILLCNSPFSTFLMGVCQPYTTGANSLVPPPRRCALKVSYKQGDSESAILPSQKLAGIELTTYRMQDEHSTHFGIAPVISPSLQDMCDVMSGFIKSGRQGKCSEGHGQRVFQGTEGVCYSTSYHGDSLLVQFRYGKPECVSHAGGNAIRAGAKVHGVLGRSCISSAPANIDSAYRHALFSNGPVHIREISSTYLTHKLSPVLSNVALGTLWSSAVTCTRPRHRPVSQRNVLSTEQRTTESDRSVGGEGLSSGIPVQIKRRSSHILQSLLSQRRRTAGNPCQITATICQNGGRMLRSTYGDLCYSIERSLTTLCLKYHC
ncbi:hypothetical protein Bbelb_181380 [Branchiostoma belcheri]|nr:hypothetical protein Bbelb_181380 [Branchiostoma belcheri]